MSKEKDDSGIILGGISFGVGPEPSAQPQTSNTEVQPTEPSSASSGPQEALPLLPLRVVVVGDFIAKNEYNAGANAPEHAIHVEAGEIDGAFRSLAPRIAIEVQSVLGGKQRVDLAPTSMKGFRPDELTSSIPLLRSLLDGKRVLERLRDSQLDVDGAAVELNRLWNGSPFVNKVLGGVQATAAPGPNSPPAAPAAAPAMSDAGVDRILDMVDMGTSADAPSISATEPQAIASPTSHEAKGKFDGFLAAVAHSGKSGRPGARPDEGIKHIEKAVGLQVGEILQHPEVRRLEEAWRGLSFLCQHLPKQGVKLEVVSARADETAEALERTIRAQALPPVSYAVVDVTIGGDAVSLQRLRAIAEVAEAHTVPVFSNAAPSLFGRSHLDDIDRLDNKAGLFDGPERAPWRAVANRPSMLWVSLGINRVLSRKAYDVRSSRIKTASVEELPNDDSAVVWMNPAWAVGTLPMKSFAKWDWPHRITGAPDGGVVENLPIQEVRANSTSNEHIAIPTEVFFSTETQRALGRIGLLALASQPNTDSVYLMSAATAYVPPPKRTYDSDTTEDEVRYPQAPLVDQLFVARLVQFLRALGSRISASSNPAEIKPVIEAALHELFEKAPPPGPEFVVDISNDSGALAISVNIHPRRFLGVQMEEISLGVPIG